MIDVEIPGAPPLLLNARLHWRSRATQAQHWKEQVGWVLKGHTPPAPWSRGYVTFTRYCGYQEPDGDNLASSFKWIQDGLVQAGLIVDDSPKHLQSEYRWGKASPREKRIRIQFVPILT